jgi:hypothetical protein
MTPPDHGTEQKPGRKRSSSTLKRPLSADAKRSSSLLNTRKREKASDADEQAVTEVSL